MTFTSLPEMFSSVFGPLAYTFSNAAETELFLEILSTRDGSRIGSKRFYNTPTSLFRMKDNPEQLSFSIIPATPQKRHLILCS